MITTGKKATAARQQRSKIVTLRVSKTREAAYDIHARAPEGVTSIIPDSSIHPEGISPRCPLVVREFSSVQVFMSPKRVALS